jgi:hypothetical protein
VIAFKDGDFNGMRNIDADFDAVFVGMFAQHLEGIVMPGLDDLDMVVIEGGSRDAIYRFHMPSLFCVDAARTNVDRGQGIAGIRLGLNFIPWPLVPQAEHG